MAKEPILEGLDDAQLRAVDWDDGAMLVLAGPGSGKTRVLTSRIARLLRETPTDSFRILALTFTTKAADEMRIRLESTLPGSNSRVFAGTFHSFANDVLRQFGSHVGIASDFRIVANEDDRRALFQDAIRSHFPNRYEAYERLLPSIDYLKSRLIPQADVVRRYREPALGERVASAYAAYEAELQAQGSLDFNGLLLNVCILLRDYPVIAERYQRTYRYWLIDEFQDTNAAQYAMMKKLAKGGFANIFAVADDDQILFQWNGASYEFIRRFQSDFGPDLVQLPMTHRCPRAVVDAANSLIQHNQTRTPGKNPLVPSVKERPSDHQIHYKEFETDQEEAESVAGELATVEATARGDVAVLARNRQILEGVRAECTKRGVKAIVAQRRDRFASPAYQWLNSSLSMACRKMDRREFDRLCTSFGQLTGREVSPENVVALASASGRDLLSEFVETVDTPNDTAMHAVVRGLLNLEAGNSNYLSWLSKAEEWLATYGSAEGSNEFSDFEDDKTAWAELRRGIGTGLGVDLALSHFLQELDSRSKEPAARPGVVQLLTIHSAKGKEFERVFLIGVAEDIIPSFQAKKADPPGPQIEEERRNCFVAITRTKGALTLSRAKRYRGYRKAPSRFLREMGLAPSE